ncbi:hypothetical protein EX30DRAFT_348830 [Ascodesmis nigricans]|uniref:Uncharacterized protein n=1 Tax=Ascodesmis nigricans TaxID=341454 RepID=A0A4S2MX94_9PEZI|nr:hypothetical protein EX30DRAFT_348830 [Ascodesmis nigricans]
MTNSRAPIALLNSIASHRGTQHLPQRRQTYPNFPTGSSSSSYVVQHQTPTRAAYPSQPAHRHPRPRASRPTTDHRKDLLPFSPSTSDKRQLTTPYTHARPFPVPLHTTAETADNTAAANTPRIIPRDVSLHNQRRKKQSFLPTACEAESWKPCFSGIQAHRENWEILQGFAGTACLARRVTTHTD